MSTPAATDRLSLTLPGAKSRARSRRRRRLPPNWKVLAALIAFDAAMIAMNVLVFAAWQSPWALFTGAAAVRSLRDSVRDWRRGDGVIAGWDRTTWALWATGAFLAWVPGPWA